LFFNIQYFFASLYEINGGRQRSYIKSKRRVELSARLGGNIKVWISIVPQIKQALSRTSQGSQGSQGLIRIFVKGNIMENRRKHGHRLKLDRTRGNGNKDEPGGPALVTRVWLLVQDLVDCTVQDYRYPYRQVQVRKSCVCGYDTEVRFVFHCW
jgi:hypothetical protein